MHNLTINNGKAEMFSGSGITPWHKLGQVVEGMLTAQEAIKKALMDWIVTLEPVFVNGKKFEDGKAVVRGDNGYILSIVGNRYETIQNHEAFSFFDDVVGSGQAIYETAGSLAGGKKIWIMAKLKGSLFLDSRPEDETHKYVLLVSSHDGSSSLMMMIVSVRVVCHNTLSIALNGATNMIKIRHTRNYESKKGEAMKALNLCNAYFDNLQEVMNELDRQAMTRADMVTFSEKLLPIKDEKESTRTENVRQEIVTLFSRGKGNLGKSRWDALNAVTEYVDHHRTTRTKENGNSEENRFSSSMFGSGLTLKTQAYTLLTS